MTVLRDFREKVKARIMKYRSIIFLLIIAAIFTCGCFQAQQSVHVQDKYVSKTFGGTDRYFIVDGKTTYECVDNSTYQALGQDGTYTVVVNSEGNMITKIIS